MKYNVTKIMVTICAMRMIISTRIQDQALEFFCYFHFIDVGVLRDLKCLNIEIELWR